MVEGDEFTMEQQRAKIANDRKVIAEATEARQKYLGEKPKVKQAKNNRTYKKLNRYARFKNRINKLGKARPSPRLVNLLRAQNNYVKPRRIIRKVPGRIPQAPTYSQNVHEQKFMERQQKLQQLAQWRRNRVYPEGLAARQNAAVQQEQNAKAEFARQTNLMATKLVVDKSADLKPTQVFDESQGFSLWNINALSGVSMPENDFHKRMKFGGLFGW